jgi:hypothetical protein
MFLDRFDGRVTSGLGENDWLLLGEFCADEWLIEYKTCLYLEN